MSKHDETSWGKTRIILGVTIPATLSMLLYKLQQMVNLIFLGHLNKAELLAGLGVGWMFTSVVGVSIIWGLNGALETLVSQAYGAGNLALCGIYLNRGRFVMFCALVPVFCVLLNTESILIAIGLD